MKYIYTDFGALPVSFTLTMDEIDALLELIANSQWTERPFFQENLEKMLLNSRKYTADLMESQAEQLRNKEDV